MAANLKVAGLTKRPLTGVCPGCGVVLAGHAGPEHAFVGASAQCWQLYRRLASPSASGPDAPRLRRLVADAYAAQHPGVPQRRSVQSVAVHLMDLCLLLERDGRIGHASCEPGRSPRRKPLGLHWLCPPDARGTMTVVDALPVDDAGDRPARIETWASQVWLAWKPHHRTVRMWLDACDGHAPAPASR